jgi:hypothetical protein
LIIRGDGPRVRGRGAIMTAGRGSPDQSAVHEAG